MTRRIALLLLAATALVTGCSTERETPLTDPAAVAAAARAAFVSYVEHANAAEWDRVLALYSDDSSFHWVEDGSIAYPTKAALATAIEGLYGAVESAHLTVDEIRVLPLTDELAWLTARWEQEMTLTGGQALSYGGATTILLRRENGRWTFLAGHNSTPRAQAGG